MRLLTLLIVPGVLATGIVSSTMSAGPSTAAVYKQPAPPSLSGPAFALRASARSRRSASRGGGTPQPSFLPGQRSLLDAHNAYPERGRFADRIDDALATGLPVAIEQDLAWCAAPSGAMAPVVSHEKTCIGGEPALEQYFFARVRPLMEAALATGPSGDWPLITLNLDFKTNEPQHHAAVWALLGRYERWLTTAPRLADGSVVAPLDVGPLLVLTGSADAQEPTFHLSVPVGERLRLFGAIAGIAAPNDQPAVLPRATPATNYRRWWNHPWRAVEPEGQPAAGAWTADDEARLHALVADAHRHGLWIRFYTLNGVAGQYDGWTASYNFGGPEAAATRWRAAVAAGVDFVATDQYAEFAASRAGR